MIKVHYEGMQSFNEWKAAGEKAVESLRARRNDLDNEASNLRSKLSTVSNEREVVERELSEAEAYLKAKKP